MAIFDDDKIDLPGFVTKVNIKGTDIVGKLAMGFAMFVLTPFLVTTVMGSGRTIRAIAGSGHFIQKEETSRVVQVFRGCVLEHEWI